MLETRTRPNSNFLSGKDSLEDVPILFLEGARENICSFQAVLKVNKINRHKSKEQLIAAYNNAGWMSPELVTIIQRVVNDFRVC